ncbi:MAG TPA: SRPBCC domain-containing protein [Vicinamibacterales bacterium]|jgi:activator of HSP90 ATPase|nr:SRPBCC domain-containing protein [Vicinamibacterales bacterium]
MTTKTLKQTVVFKGASPRAVYDLIMVSRKHASLSGQKAVISQKVGGAFSAWNGHLTGFNLALRSSRKIVQAWRATGWWPDHYSIAIFDFQKVAAGTKLTFTQIGIPPHRYSGHYRGWIETYWTPMQEMLRDGHLSQNTLARVKVDREQRIKAGHFRRTISTRS